MWKFFWDHIKEEMDLISNTPIISSVAFLVAISIGLLIAKWRYGKMVELLKLHCAFLKEKLDSAPTLIPKPKSVLPPAALNATKNMIGEQLSRQSKIDRILVLLKDIDFKLSQMKPEDYLSPLMLESHPMKLLKKREELIAQLDKLGHNYP